MLETGVEFKEPAVQGADALQRTDDICRKLTDDNYFIDGCEVKLPVRVQSAAMLMNAFIVPANAAKEIIEGSGLKLIEIWPGKALLLLIAVGYRKGDLGDYNEGAIIFPVLTPGKPAPLILGGIIGVARGSASIFVYRMPVDQPFTTHAGRFIWGFPKWVAQMYIEFGDGNARGRFFDEGELVYEIFSATGGMLAFRNHRASALAIRNGMAWKTSGIGSGAGVRVRLGGVEPRIGDRHPLANQLRMLGLPKKPLFTVSAADVQMRFGVAEPLAINAPLLGD